MESFLSRILRMWYGILKVKNRNKKSDSLGVAFYLIILELYNKPHLQSFLYETIHQHKSSYGNHLF